MNRQEFIKNCTALGLGAFLFPSLLNSCDSTEDPFPQFDVNFSGKVLIIGAGAAGITAAYVLSQYGIDFELIEAAPTYGGRVKESVNFTDFPIDLGAEWIHTDGSILSVLVNDPNVDARIELINYSPETISLWKNGKLRRRNFFSNFYGELKFKNTTWFSFFETYMVPAIRDKMILNSPVSTIDYSTDQISVTNTRNEQFTGDRLILTVPLTVLKQERIDFNPPLPAWKTDALRGVEMPDGVKVFIEFSEDFYPDLTYTGGISELTSDTDGEKIYYDAAFGKDSDRNIMALFTVGEPATQYTSLPNDAALIAFILNELDEIFDGKASQSYVRHISQNWSNEPFIGGSYSHYQDESVREDLIAPVDGKIYFAGETYAPEDYATVHGAGQSAFVAVEEILKG